MYVLDRPQVRRKAHRLDIYRFKEYISKTELEYDSLLFEKKRFNVEMKDE